MKGSAMGVIEELGGYTILRKMQVEIATGKAKEESEFCCSTTTGCTSTGTTWSNPGSRSPTVE